MDHWAEDLTHGIAVGCPHGAVLLQYPCICTSSRSVHRQLRAALTFAPEHVLKLAVPT